MDLGGEGPEDESIHTEAGNNKPSISPEASPSSGFRSWMVVERCCRRPTRIHKGILGNSKEVLKSSFEGRSRDDLLQDCCTKPAKKIRMSQDTLANKRSSVDVGQKSGGTSNGSRFFVLENHEDWEDLEEEEIEKAENEIGRSLLD